MRVACITLLATALLVASAAPSAPLAASSPRGQPARARAGQSAGTLKPAPAQHWFKRLTGWRPRWLARRKLLAAARAGGMSQIEMTDFRLDPVVGAFVARIQGMHVSGKPIARDIAIPARFRWFWPESSRAVVRTPGVPITRDDLLLATRGRDRDRLDLHRDVEYVEMMGVAANLPNSARELMVALATGAALAGYVEFQSARPRRIFTVKTGGGDPIDMHGPGPEQRSLGFKLLRQHRTQAAIGMTAIGEVPAGTVYLQVKRVEAEHAPAEAHWSVTVRSLPPPREQWLTGAALAAVFAHPSGDAPNIYVLDAGGAVLRSFEGADSEVAYRRYVTAVGDDSTP